MSRTNVCLLFGTVVLWVTSACAQAPVTTPAHYYFMKSDHKAAAEWGYEGAIGPSHWATLDPSYRVAGNGHRQSPIDIPTAELNEADLAPLRFEYQIESVTAYNNGHTIQHDDAPGSFLFVGEERYALEQFHVHTPSEHTIDGRSFAMEVHFVHKSAAGNVAVVAVLVEAVDEEGIQLPPLVLPDASGKGIRYEGRRNPNHFLPTDLDYYEYSGSFTTPPCSEGVRWIVLKQPVKKNRNRIQEFATILNGNNRPTQPLYGRQIQTRNR